VRTLFFNIFLYDQLAIIQSRIQQKEIYNQWHQDIDRHQENTALFNYYFKKESHMKNIIGMQWFNDEIANITTLNWRQAT